MGIDVTTIDQMKTMKGKNECLLWEFLKKFVAKCEDVERVFKVFTIMVHGMVIFPKVSNHVEATVVDLVEQVDHQANHVLAIVAKTIRSLNFFRIKGEGHFFGCVQLLYLWIKSHFWGTYMKPLKYYMDTFVPLNEFTKKEWPIHQLMVQWVATLRNLSSDNKTWKAPWFSRKLALYGCGDKLWVPLIRLWGVFSYAPLLVLRQYGSEQFIPAIYGLNILEFE